MSRAQMLALGLTRSQAGQRVRSGSWQRLHPGVFAMFTGPVGDRARIQAALLAAGPDATAGGRTALWLAGFLTRAPEIVQVCVPHGRTVQAPRGAVVLQRRNLDRLRQPGSSPPRIRFEAALLDAAQAATSAQPVLTEVFAALQRRFTTVQRLDAELRARPRHRWRAVLADVLTDAHEGAASPLEQRYLRDVERPHGLPRASRNRPRVGPDGRIYRDAHYEEWGLVAELDGRGAHPVEGSFRDWRRDNCATLADLRTLRYGWVDVVMQPCAVAWQVAQLLQRYGWTGQFRRCPRCPP